MPPIGLLMGKVDFQSLFINLSGTPQPSLAAAKAAGAPTLNYGVFLQGVFDFLIIAFVIFILVKQVDRFKKEAPLSATARADERRETIDGDQRRAARPSLSATVTMRFPTMRECENSPHR